MRKLLLALLTAGTVMSLYATDARVIAMGRHDDFFADETSIFRNPADLSLYPSLIEGSLGTYRSFKGDSSSIPIRDPVDPYFGATFVHPLSSHTDRPAKIAVGAFFNRHDEMLDYLSPASARYVGDTSRHIPSPDGKIDLILGCALNDGPMIGLGAYAASQSYRTGSMIDSEVSIYKLNAGIDWPLGDSRLELWGGGGVLRAKGDSTGFGTRNAIVAYDDPFFTVDARLFIGSLVPQIHYRSTSLYKRRVSLSDLSAGLGYNRPLDRGLVWAGLQFVASSGSYFDDSSTSDYGGKVSFGFEHSVWGEWLYLRGGGQKVLLYRSIEPRGKPTKRFWHENAAADGSDDDCVGLGLGIVAAKRLHVDFVVSEDLPYTFANLLGGPEQYLFSRISARYGF